MIQDIYPNKFDIAYIPNEKPDGTSIVLYFEGRNLLCNIDENRTLTLPTYVDFKEYECEYTFIFRIDDMKVFLAHDLKKAFDFSDIDGANKWQLNDVNFFRTVNPRLNGFIAVTAFHISNWYVNNKFCGKCGALTVHDANERMMRCPKCGNMIFPKIMPSVIVAVTNGDKLLLTRYNRPGAELTALIAGFTEIGESSEDTVRREVLEEVGIRVKNIRFYKTQPWGISGGGLLLGFWCEVDGDDTIKVDGTELAEGRWLSREELKTHSHDTGYSLTGEMIDVFTKGGC